MVAATASRPVLKRYWVTASRDYNGRLPEDLCIRIEWEESGVTRMACGHFSGEAIEWLSGEVPPEIDDLATDAAVDAGEYAEAPNGGEFMGIESVGEMYSKCERACLTCGALAESVDRLDATGRCSHCFIAQMGAAS